jgi:hypothetical protein
MGGQACIFYGAAESSRDLDLLILADAINLANLARALDTEVIAVPPLEEGAPIKGARGPSSLPSRRCRTANRFDVFFARRRRLRRAMSRRTTIEVAGEPIDLLAMEDLVRAKKTQRDKDWPMIRRLVERSFFGRPTCATQEMVRFWLRELRTPELLVEVAGAHPELARAEAVLRPAVQAALSARREEVSETLEAENGRNAARIGNIGHR